MEAERGFYKALSTVLKLTVEQIALIRAVLTGKVSFDDHDKLPKTAGWIRQCHHRPNLRELTMSAMDEVIETYGVESFILRNGKRVEYCNSGDTYTPTILYYNGKLRVGDWGYYAERYGTRDE